MIRTIIFGTTIALTTLLAWTIGLRPAAACNRIAGCIMDNIAENYEMMHSNKMNEAIAAGKENIDAFNRLRNSERSVPTRHSAK